jgi:uncharacterized protein (TIGR03435 family)
MANKIVVIAAVLLVAAPAVCGIGVSNSAPAINLQALIPDQPVTNASLIALRGKAVVIEFWATWCAPCVDAIPHLNELAKQFASRPIQFISVTSEEKAVVEKFMKTRPIAGWIGFDPGNKMAKTYGFEGIPDTVLIDAKGKIAAVTYPTMVKAEHLEALLVGKELKLPPVGLNMTIRRESLETEPTPMLDIIVRPSTAGNSSGMRRGGGTYQWKGTPINELFSAAYEIPTIFVEGDAFGDPKRYDVSIVGPNSEDTAIGKVLPDLLAIAFHVTAKRETRETEGWILTAPNGKPEALKEAAGSGGSSQAGGGILKITGSKIGMLARMMQFVLKKPVADKTGIQGSFDLALLYEEGRPESLLESLRKIGFALESAKLPTEFLIVSKK